MGRQTRPGSSTVPPARTASTTDEWSG